MELHSPSQVLSREEALATFLKLTSRYGTHWTSAVPKEAYDQLAACNRVLTERDRRDALLGSDH
jgi:hypothetical protein